MNGHLLAVALVVATIAGCSQKSPDADQTKANMTSADRPFEVREIFVNAESENEYA